MKKGKKSNKCKRLLGEQNHCFVIGDRKWVRWVLFRPQEAFHKPNLFLSYRKKRGPFLGANFKP